VDGICRRTQTKLFSDSNSFLSSEAVRETRGASRAAVFRGYLSFDGWT
jgi:biotin operon repressor